MLRTNNKKFLEKIDNYILENARIDELEENAGLKEICNYVYKYFKKVRDIPYYRHYYKTELENFVDWSTGIPTHLFDEIWYSNYYRAVDIVGDLLEQTETERNKFDNDQAATFLTQMIYRQILKNTTL